MRKYTRKDQIEYKKQCDNVLLYRKHTKDSVYNLSFDSSSTDQDIYSALLSARGSFLN